MTAYTAKVDTQQGTPSAIMPLVIFPEQADVVFDRRAPNDPMTVPQVTIRLKEKNERPSFGSAVVVSKSNYKLAIKKSWRTHARLPRPCRVMRAKSFL